MSSSLHIPAAPAPSVPRRRVLVGVSGGIDSSVALAMMKDQGYEPVAAMFHFWAEENVGRDDMTEKFPENKCCSVESLFRARQVAAWVGVPFVHIDIRERFREAIVDFFLDSYRSGLTPNPCTQCNRHIKSQAFLDEADKQGCDYVATGHYARVERDEAAGLWRLRRGVDAAKDQSFFLYTYTQAKMQRMLLPLGGYTKDQVRELAVGYGFDTQYKKVRESQDLCFYAEQGPQAFLRRHLPVAHFAPGPVVHAVSGATLGQHEGLPLYTLGQRRGLHTPGGSGVPLFVTGKDPASNTLYVGPRELVMHSNIALHSVHWLAGTPPPATQLLAVQIRYRSAPLPCSIMSAVPAATGVARYGEADLWQVQLALPQPALAPTPGQAAVLYSGDEVIGGGIIS